jgi:hypothetical protein
MTSKETQYVVLVDVNTDWPEVVGPLTIQQAHDYAEWLESQGARTEVQAILTKREFSVGSTA